MILGAVRACVNAEPGFQTPGPGARGRVLYGEAMNDALPGPLRPIENRASVRANFQTWLAALAADDRFAAIRGRVLAEATEEAEIDKDGFRWHVTLRPTGIKAGINFTIRLHNRSASFSPLDRNSQTAFGSATDGAVYVLRQWHDTKRIGSRPLHAEDLVRYHAPIRADLVNTGQSDVGRGRLYMVVAKLTDPPAEVARQTFDAMTAFHRVAEQARAEFL